MPKNHIIKIPTQKGEIVSRETLCDKMKMLLQIFIIALTVTCILTVINEAYKIYTHGKVKAKLFILCVPETDNIEELSADLLNRYRRKGLEEDILIVSEELNGEAKQISSLIEATDKGIYFIKPEDLIKIIK